MLTFRQRAGNRARIAETEDDLEAARALRTLAFRGPGHAAIDRDDFDAACTHVLVEEARGGALVCCFRLLHLGSGAEIGPATPRSSTSCRRSPISTGGWSRWGGSASTPTGATPTSCASLGAR